MAVHSLQNYSTSSSVISIDTIITCLKEKDLYKLYLKTIVYHDALEYFMQLIISVGKLKNNNNILIHFM